VTLPLRIRPQAEAETTAAAEDSTHALLDARAEQRTARRFGWTSLLGWASFGLVLEAAHAWKLAAMLDDELARMLVRLGHAHGTVLALVVLAFGEAGAPLFAAATDARLAGRLLRAAALLVPFGFALSAVAHPEGDPNVLVFLVPAGAVCLLGGLALATRAAWRG
jgi:hypothetical protein